MQFKDDHFYKQFDRYPEGQERFEAMARHAATLLNTSEEQRANEVAALTRIRDALANDESPAKVVLAIQERLMSEFDTWQDCPTVDDLRSVGG